MSSLIESKIHHRSYAKIDIDALKHNYNEIKRRVGESVRLMAIIKADAYSHGAVRIAEEFDACVDYFGVALVEEAVQLRESGIKSPILILSYTLPYQYHLLLRHDITQTVSSLEEARLLSDIAKSFGKTIKIHIALDTGMSRIGFDTSEKSLSAIKKISLLPNIEIEGIFSHYACADESDKHSAGLQTELFKGFIERLEADGITIPIKHICNSAGIIDLDEHFDLVRMGIAFYGLYPSSEVRRDNVNLLPAMEIISHIVHLHTVPKGVGVSYGLTYVTERETKIATVGIGYADGYPRSLSNKSRVLIHGKFAPVIGRVCMDLMMVDVTDIPDVKVEDSVTIMGRQGENEITAEELGELSGSFNYEIVCSFKKRVARVYYKNNAPVD